MIKVGFIGCGWIVEKAHIPAFQKIEGACIQAVYDTDYKRAGLIGKTFRIPLVCRELDELLEADIDAVIIATPNHLHSIHSDAALRAGKHVLCEKPVALSARDYQNTLKLARANNKIMMPAFVNRFRPDIIKLGELLKDPGWGSLESIEARWMRRSGVPRPGTWITNKELAGGGVLVDLGSHLLDICIRHVSDKTITAAEVYHTESNIEKAGAVWCGHGNHDRLRADVETAISGGIEFAKGLHLQFDLSWNSDIQGDFTTFVFHFESRTVVLKTLFGFSTNGLYKTPELYLETDGNREEVMLDLMNCSQAPEAFDRQAEHFIHAVKTGSCQAVDFADAAPVIEAIEQLYSVMI